MNARAKRAFSALATVSVLTVTVCVALATVPVSAECVSTESKTVTLTPSGGTNGNVGDAMAFTVTVWDVWEEHWEGPTPVGVGVACRPGGTTPARGESGTFSFSGLGGSESASFVTDSVGKATVTHTFSRAGTYTVQAQAAGFSSTGVTIVIDGSPTASTPTPSVSPSTPNNGGQTPAVSSATPTATASEAALSLESLTGAARTPIRPLWWVLAIAAIILLAIIATALLMRRRG